MVRLLHMPRICRASLNVLLILAAGVGWPAPPGHAAEAASLWQREELVAWCIVPYDAKKRDAPARAAMLERLHVHKLAYDWRAEHVAAFDTEVTTMAQHGIELVAWWFPTKLDDTARRILEVIERHKIHPQLWVTGGGALTKNDTEQSERIASEVARLRPIVGEAARLGCKVGLYNHGGWFGEPENQLAVLARLRAGGATNVGLVYNFHHGHDHLERFAKLWPQMQSAVLAVNLNGMVAGGDQLGKQIHYLGDGDHELALIDRKSVV